MIPIIVSAILGAAALAYVIYLISGVGIAVIGFIGIILLVYSIFMMILQLKENQVVLSDIQEDRYYALKRLLHNIENKTRYL